MDMKNGAFTIASTNEAVEFKFKTDLKVTEKSSFISHATGLIAGDNYFACLTDLIFDFEVLMAFTDISFEEMKDENDYIDMDKVEMFINDTNAVEIVKANAKPGLIESLKKSLQKNIEYKTGVRENRIEDTIVEFIKLIEDKVSAFNTDEMMDMASKITSMTGELTPEKMLEAYSKTDMFKRNQEARQVKSENLEAIIEENIGQVKH